MRGEEIHTPFHKNSGPVTSQSGTMFMNGPRVMGGIVGVPTFIIYAFNQRSTT